LRILLLSSEVFPYSKTGGLADVAGSLPGALKDLGADVRIISPLYRSARNGDERYNRIIENLPVRMGDSHLSCGVQEILNKDDVPVLFLEREDLYDRPNLYRGQRGDYYDNFERFAFFCKASLLAAKTIDFRPHVIHCNDWQTGLTPAFLKGAFAGDPFFSSIASIFTIHNVGFQGLFPPDKLDFAGLSRDEFFHREGLEYWGNISLLKAGIVYCDAVTTVSPTYALEIQGPEHGRGMEGILFHRRASLHGILNGVDYRMWDPSDDSYLPASYGPKDLGGKDSCKASLLHETGLQRVFPDMPLLSLISRLDHNKGLDLLLEGIDPIMEMGAGLIVLGTGEESIEAGLMKASADYPGRIALRFTFDEPLAHRIMAGSDIFLVPSLYEPCGLTQMYAMKYGTIPVVRRTGGLKDTVSEFDPSKRTGTGVTFGPYESDAFVKAVEKAVGVFRNPLLRGAIRANAMAEDFSWKRSAKQYIELYRSVLKQ